MAHSLCDVRALFFRPLSDSIVYILAAVMASGVGGGGGGWGRCWSDEPSDCHGIDFSGKRILHALYF